MNKNQAYYETRSLSLAITLICCGITLESVKKNPDGKSVFIFLQSPELTKTIQLFWARALKIEPILFWETQRFLKSRIYGE